MDFNKWLLGGLSESEWRELLALEYVLTWNYTDDIDGDNKRYQELSKRKWAGRNQYEQSLKTTT